MVAIRGGKRFENEMAKLAARIAKPATRVGMIYRITIDRGKEPPAYYFGQTANAIPRWQKHLWSLRCGQHDNVRMQNSFKKYGESSFSLSILIVCDPNHEVMTLYEQCILDLYLRELGKGRVLNVMRQCVNTHLGVKRRPETIERMSAAQKGRKKTPDQIAEMSRRQIGCHHSDETKARISASHKAIPRNTNSLAALELARSSPSRLEGLRAALAGKPKIHSEETKAKIAASLTGRKQSAELIERRISSLRGRKQTDEEIAKRVASRLANAKKMEAA